MPLTPLIAHEFLPRIRERGEKIFRSGVILIVSGTEEEVRAKVRGTSVYLVELSREGKNLKVACTCPYFETEGECKHVWAVLLEAEKRGLLGSNQQNPPSHVHLAERHSDDDEEGNEEDDEEEEFEEEFLPVITLPKQPSPATPRFPDWYLTVAGLSRPDSRAANKSWPVNREIYYFLMGSIKVNQKVSLRVMVRDQLKRGGWGQFKSENFTFEVLNSVPDALDREILLSLAGSEQTYAYSKIDFRLEVELYAGQAEILLPKICRTGRCLLQRFLSEEPRTDQPLQWDEGNPWQFQLVPEREGRYWRFSGYFKRGEERLDLKDLQFVSAAGFLASATAIARADSTNGLFWVNAVWPKSKLLIPDKEMDMFLQQFSQLPSVPGVDWPPELALTETRNTPQPQLAILSMNESSPKNSSYQAALHFDYGDFVTAASEGEAQCHYNPVIRQLTWRNPEFELAAAKRLSELGAKPHDQRTPFAYQWEVDRSRLVPLFSALQDEGWKVEAEGRAFRRATQFEAQLSTGIDWFDLNGVMNFEGQRVPLPDLLRALAAHERAIVLPDNSIGFIPDDFIEKYRLLAGLGVKEGEAIRFKRSQARLLDVLLAAQPEVRADQGFAEYRAKIREWERIGAVDQPAGFVGALRDYQREGLGWLQFLAATGLGGCLADDMGVGKTAQVLALFESRRQLREENQDSRPRPSLVVAPRSVIFNWKQEAARFTPQLQILDHTQAERHENLTKIENYDIVLATYGILRRDIAKLRKIRFDHVVLDEAQAIKNAASDSAKAARLLQADHKLALSGTPVENHLGELRSLFDFLNPGMLGSTASGLLSDRRLKSGDEQSRMLLSRALRPFLLRRTKEQVARELPAKTEQTLYCEMTTDQRKLYNELRDHYRRNLLGNLDASRWGKSRMQVLEALLRLRQAACHPGLIDKKRREETSAKLDTLIAQMLEVIEGGHKLLVFSQFTSFLSLVRSRLEQEKVQFAYLDGRTKDRQACVEQFQTDPSCPAFLISLKAGGLGLNLTAAEYVFLLDPWWNPAVEAQAIDRAHRIGQTNQVFAYRLITRDTVEEKVLQLQDQKRRLSDAILTDENKNLNALTREDLDLLLS